MIWYSLTPYQIAEAAIQQTYAFIEQVGLPLTQPEVNVTTVELFEEMVRIVEPDLQKAFVSLDSSDLVRILQDCMTEELTFTHH